jgi:chromosome partitioning protein
MSRFEWITLMSRILAIVNQKGGVGKTTTAINLAAALAEDGQRTLLVDMDPQGNATTGLGATKSTLQQTIYEVLLGECRWEDAVIPTSLENLDILPSTLDLAGAAIEMATLPERELRLRHGLERTGDRYRFIIIDTPPSLGLLPINCLAAAEGIIIPMQCEFYALEGLAQLEHTVRLMKRGVNPRLDITGILLTMVDLRARLFRDVINAVRKQYGQRVFNTEVPRSVRFAEAPSYGESVISYEPKGKGAKAYRALAKEVEQRC